MKGDGIAVYFQIDPAIVQHIPELLKDLWALGSDPDWIAQTLEDLGLQPGAQILDLGTGKGAVAITLAEKLNARVHGVDMLEPFVVEARNAAQDRGVAGRCRFTQGDVREAASDSRDYDVVLFVSVGDVLGPMNECVSLLRRAVRPGGYIVIDDAYAIDTKPIGFAGYGNLLTYEETSQQLTAHGDTIVRERLLRPEDVKAQNEQYTAWITERAKRLSELHPEHAAHFDAFVEKEREESHLLETKVECATWVVQKTDSAEGRGE